MSTSPRAWRYSPLAQGFHWLIVVLVVTQFALAISFGDLPLGMQKLALMARHKSFGMTILMLAVLRLLWRANNPPPPLPSAMSTTERILANVNHYGLYFLLFAMPLSGWLMSSAKNYSVSWFGVFTWPNLVGPNEQTFAFFKGAHGILAALLLLSVAVHTIAALKHHFWNKDDVLRRMLPFAKPRKL